MSSQKEGRTLDKAHLSRKEKWREIVFESDTRDARLFDVILLWAIVISVLTVMLSSVDHIAANYKSLLTAMEWGFTLLFTIEYITRIFLSVNKKSYIFSFWGIIDLVSTIPTYIGLLIHGPQYLLMIRSLRLLRVFRILRLSSYQGEAKSLTKALRASSAKITVFFAIILCVVILMGTLMYIVESGPNSDFTSIPASIYWAIVTITTVGYGDMTPVTVAGKFISSLVMIMGYAVITVPTGIVSVEYAQQKRTPKQSCPNCGFEEIESNDKFCKNCGAPLSS